MTTKKRTGLDELRSIRNELHELRRGVTPKAVVLKSVNRRLRLIEGELRKVVRR